MPAADAAPAISSTRADGGSVVTDLGDGIAVNKGSSRRRQWITLHDPSLPLDISGSAGIQTEWRGTDRGYEGSATYTVHANEPISAFELRVMLFDVWGDFLRTCSDKETRDISAGDTPITSDWTIYDESEVGYVYSVAYVARVLTASGKTFQTNDDAVLAEARKISALVRKEDLTPQKSPGKSGSN